MVQSMVGNTVPALCLEGCPSFFSIWLLLSVGEQVREGPAEQKESAVGKTKKKVSPPGLRSVDC